MTADQGNEGAGTMILALNSLLRFAYAHQSLRVAGGADGKNEAASDSKLGHRRFRDVWRACNNENRILGCVSRPTESTVETLDGGVVYTQRSDSCLRFTSKLSYSLHCITWPATLASTAV